MRDEQAFLHPSNDFFGWKLSLKTTELNDIILMTKNAMEKLGT